jgi:hypothetical protein
MWSVPHPCFPDLPGGRCWPQDDAGAFKGCFPQSPPHRRDRHALATVLDALIQPNSVTGKGAPAATRNRIEPRTR